MTTETAVILGLRAAASTMELIYNGGFNLHKVAIAVESAAKHSRQATDDELLATADTVERKIDMVFGDPKATALRGVEPNDNGGPHDEH